MTSSHEITLEQILQAREERAEKQKKLINEYQLPLVSFTINMPGARKKTPTSGRIFKEGYAELKRRLMEKYSQVVYEEIYDLATGSGAYLVVNTHQRVLKELMVQIENQHPLGRLFDFDVIGLDGNAISRSDLGYPVRKCLLCQQDAHACARSARHSIHDLVTRIQAMVDSYFESMDV